jgi:protein-serine/threonine kinase
MLGSGAYGRVHMAFNRNTGRQFACKIVDLQAARANFQAKAREAQVDSGEQQQSTFFATQPRPLKYTATTGKSSLISKAFLDKIAMQQRESLLLAELSHVSVSTILLDVPDIRA